MKRWMFLMLIIALVGVLAACSGNNEEYQGDEEETESFGETGDSEVIVDLMDTNEEQVAKATLTEGESGVDIALEGENLPPGEHGFHFHETGSCELPDFESAGGHYNPTDANHGMNDPDGPHAGDMENIEVDEDGTVDTEVTADMVTLEEGEDNTLFTEEGTALMIHSEADDYESQPSGDAGDRIACGVVGE
ncbi:MAG TPA: superoxide dismutase family protein [Candidatus Salinicoccus stercoripullorum]|uniref:Superoxide dismutase [Cu-Zn] n=1 Tax=Candidatus Salinicoccus stercoripullorum TaxID=2838756 RepID=A0A9D1U0X3_9STAP|nr:superoxide dismutase family protein [Candidatus Salinicoccus stercoripullorum]